jgi:adhesin transport system membrane fusion protein
MLRLFIAVFVILIFWASTSEIEQVVHAQGQIIASSRTQLIQVSDGGILVDLKVKEGDSVKEGDLLANLETERVIAAYKESYSKESSLRLTIARLVSELEGNRLVFDPRLIKDFPEIAKTEMNLYKKRRLSYLSQIEFLDSSIKYQNEELDMNMKLEATGDVSRADILRLKKSINDAKGNLEAQKNKYIQEVSTELNKARAELGSQQQIVQDKKQLLKHAEIRSPSAGIVKSVRMTTLGAVLRQGDELLQILPTDTDLIIEAKVKPSDMTFIEEGLPVSIKLDAYDYSIYGVLSGKVVYISADTLTEEVKGISSSFYRVKINVDKNSYINKISKRIEFRPGMTSTVDIKTGKRNVLAIIFKPLTKTLKESFVER